MLFSCSAALAMVAAVATVGVALYLMTQAESLAMTTSVDMALAAVRRHLPTVNALFAVAIVGLFAAAFSLLFSMCHDSQGHAADYGICVSIGFAVLSIFTCF